MDYNPFSLENKTILVTGASSGIGQATAIACSKLGASVIISARNEDRLKKTLEDLDYSHGQTHRMILADVATDEGISKVVDFANNIDGLSSNVGMNATYGPIKFLKDENVELMMRTNTLSHLKLAKMLFKKKILNKGASCVFTASIGGTVSFGPGNTIYGMTKAALESFMRYAAIEFASRDIRCNCICPGMVETPLIKMDSLTEDDIKIDIDKYLLKRYGRPEEIALTTAFLLSNASSYITGASIVVDGGYTINH